MLGILLSALCFAEPQFVALAAGEIAPFSGRLLNDEAIAKIGVEDAFKVEQCNLQINYELEKQKLELEKEITKAFVSAYDEQAEALFNNYLDHAEAYVNMTTVKDAVTNEEISPDENFMASIEEQIGITGTSRENFRVDITAFMFSKLRRGDKVDWQSYAPLKEAIESKLTSSVKQISRIVTKSKSRDKKQQGKYNEMVKTLIDEYGYNEDSAEEVIKFAANNLWRDS